MESSEEPLWSREPDEGAVRDYKQTRRQVGLDICNALSAMNQQAEDALRRLERLSDSYRRQGLVLKSGRPFSDEVMESTAALDLTGAYAIAGELVTF